MFKKLVSVTMALLGVFSLYAQSPMPENPNVKHGTLPNGMNYYILHNEEPKQRANFYIAQKVGSTLEAPDQLGLAHFLEHMAFNGTEHYPGKAMLNYLQSKGIRFGADINAYTSFDETVYNINNVPTTDVALMDSVLLALHDWSCAISLETNEINAERNIIQEEWRSRDNAQTRMYTAMLPQIYDEYQYRQMPIGTMEVVMNFDPDVLRAYYHKWYRPDQQGIVIVGDFDAAEMEKKVVAMFTPIEMPANAAPREYPQVSDNKEPIYFAFQDKELTNSRVTLSFKSDKTPFDQRNTVEGYMGDNLFPNIVSQLINNRLDEFSKDASCKYAAAVVYFGDFYVSKTKDAFNIIVIPKDDVKGAFEQGMEIVARACKTGFTASELDRVKEEIKSAYEKQYNERNNTKSDALGQELIRHFIDNEPAPGIEIEKQIVDMFLPQLTVDVINGIIKDVMTPENQVLVVSAPESFSLPTKEEMLGVVNDAMTREYEAYVDEVITDPLITKYNKAGKVKSVKENSQFGATEYTLSNGVKVIVKPTDFKSDEIQLVAVRDGGKQIYSTSQADNVQLLESAYETAKKGNFDNKTMTKYLAGKTVSLGYSMGSYTDVLQGKSSVKDFETMLDMVYASFCQLGDDKAAYDADASSSRAMLANQEKNPMFTFQKKQVNTLYNNPLLDIISTDNIDKASYPQMMTMLRNVFANAADYTFIIVGNVNQETLQPMLEKYVASLPSKGKAVAPKAVTQMGAVKGIVDEAFDQTMQTPLTVVFDCYNGMMNYSVASDVMVDIFGDILSNVFTETIREEEGGSYSPYAYAYFNVNENRWNLVEVIQTNAEMRDKVMARANEETLKLMKNGANADQFNKVREAALKQFEINERTNSYWVNGLMRNVRGIDTMTGRRAAIENLTLEQFNAFINTLWNGENRVKVVMTGVEEGK